MKMKKHLFIALGCAVTCCAISLPTSAIATDGTLTGQIGVQVSISDGCTVSNGTSTEGTNNWGTIDFGTYADLSAVTDGSLSGESSGTGLAITCTSDLSPSLTLDGGLHENAKSVRTMTNSTTTSSTSVIPYRLYSDSAYSKEITPGSAMSLTPDETALTVPIYAQIRPGDQTSTAPDSGTYTDTITATLTW